MRNISDSKEVEFNRQRTRAAEAAKTERDRRTEIKMLASEIKKLLKKGECMYIECGVPTPLRTLKN